MIKKLLATPCLLSLLIGCGKEIKNSKEEKKVIEAPALEAESILLKVDEPTNDNDLYTKSAELPSDGWARIPERPLVLNNDALTFKTKIIFNASEESIRSEVEEIACEYFSIKQITPVEEPDNDGYNHYFKGCYTFIDGIKEDVNYIPGQEFPFNKGNQIRMEINSSSTNGRVQINSDIDVDWH